MYMEEWIEQLLLRMEELEDQLKKERKNNERIIQQVKKLQDQFDQTDLKTEDLYEKLLLLAYILGSKDSFTISINESKIQDLLIQHSAISPNSDTEL
ncbi:CII-binding regulator of phage lambda lysogenization HflD [Salirhabdus euzebyi]|uniref:CII-binding regulator of phage lambda lysogenization HflD n=1 Tax=Salirhabdus euzebyi TaxID=394506 RepID=A0A841Q7V0_9BACI|nr:hypothetical protein [Salirhabdus euzebyi]MBB6454500.1 CII-binding regulator of phage lambda lysogenization HflD [Salirhabdus euzebyi]